MARSGNQREVWKRTPEKVVTRAIVLGNGQIGWELGEWCVAHWEGLITAKARADQRL